MSARDLERVRVLSERVRAQERELADAVEQRNDAICEAVDRAGHTLGDVAKASGLHKSRLSRILWEAGTVEVV